MTAQIAVLTPSGAAIASDGATTVGGSRAYAGAEKVAVLSESARVATMSYGEAAFLGTPWATHFANFRHNETAPPRDLSDCATDFFDLVRSKITPENERAWIRQYLLQRVYRYEHDRVVSCLSQRSWRQARAVKRMVAESLQEWSARNFCLWFDEDSLAAVRAQHRQELVDCAGSVFADVSIDESTVSLLVEIGAQSLVRDGPQASGVVFVGFGSDRDLPSMLEVAVKGVALGLPLLWVKSSAEVAHGWPIVCSFAQDSGAQAFLAGADPAYREFVFELVDKLVVGIAESLLRELGGRAKTRERLASLLESLRDDVPTALHQGLQTYEQSNFRQPTLNALAGMSPAALAEVAYSLVSLTWLRQRVGLETPTVGGRIDSLSLSKSLGVRWHDPPGAAGERL